METALMNADRRTDMMKLIGAFHDCANAPEIHKHAQLCPRING
jgi:hypothetical protein